MYDQMGLIILIGNYKKNKMQHHVIVFKGDDHKIAWNIFLIELVGTDKIPGKGAWDKIHMRECGNNRPFYSCVLSCLAFE